jgi:capsular polysaccharide biosynthesis protein
MLELLLVRILEAYFRHRWLYLLPVLVMLMAAVVSLSQQEPLYISRASVYVERESLLSSLTDIQDQPFSWSGPAKLASDEIQELLSTDAFVRAVLAQTPLESELAGGPEAVERTLNDTRRHLWVTAAGINLVHLSAAHEDAETAHALAHALLDTFLQWRINAGAEGSAAAQDFFRGVIQVYSRDVEDAQAALDAYLLGHPEPLVGDRPENEQLTIEQRRSELELAYRRLEKALDQEENARLAMAQVSADVRQTYRVIDEPTLPHDSERSLKSMAVNLVIFVAVGTLISFGAIIGSALMDTSFRVPIDVKSRLHLPVLAVVPDQRSQGPSQ